MKRILIADSGSTKTDWVKICRDECGTLMKSETYCGCGLNPYLNSAVEIEAEMQNAERHLGCEFEEIHFYGAGIGNVAMSNLVRQCIGNVFKCNDIEADGDMLGAAIAVLGKNPGVACIMGTGSNSCHYDGERIDRSSVSLGYILDDNGGGVAFGRRLLLDIFKETAPKEITDAFQLKYNLTEADVTDHIYKQSSPNRWIAGFMPFILEFKDHPYMKSLISSQLECFFDREFHIYSECELKEEGVGFVGSIAYLLKEEISDFFENRGWKIINILRKPLDFIILENESKKNI